MRAWRLTREAFRQDPLSGQGAARAGSRWNSPGVRMGYASSSRPLAILEMLVHVTRHTVPADTILIPIEVPDELIMKAQGLPNDWNALPYSSAARQFGDRWAREATSAVLLVPSVILPSEDNLLINPAHPQFNRLEILPPESFQFDRRLLR
ncbi:MAG TPA: RES family NAD+ phosphorylase [Burkholderiales bacterium]|nr:RES family NAD+ phosphorylase [Burkholderiales bacterium]